MATFDLLMAADPRFVGGTAGAIADELRCLHGSGLRVGLLPLEFAAFEPGRAVHPAIEQVVAEGLAAWAGDGDEATLVAVHNPMVVDQPRPGFRVSVRAGACVIVAHQPPLDGRGVPWYLARRSEETCRRYFGVDPVWAPISPVCRQALVASGMDIDLLDEDWTNVVFVDDWGTTRTGPVCERPTIGRVSRDARDKWPASREVLFAAYPPDGPVAVRVLGMSRLWSRRLGGVPPAWEVHEQGTMDVRAFLDGIDVFVYFHHPHWIEAFGRTVAEAIGAGVPCILPRYMQATFGEMALYAEPAEAVPMALALCDDREGYASRSQSARAQLAHEYGPERHRRLLMGLVEHVRSHGTLTGRAYPVGRRGTDAARRVALSARRWVGDAERALYSPIGSARSIAAKLEGRVRSALGTL